MFVCVIAECAAERSVMNILKRYNNEKGFALILALSMLAIMSILGAFALMTSTTEVQISGNYNAGQQAFSAAERTMEVGAALIRNVGSVNIDDPDNPNHVLIDDLRIGISGPVPGTVSEPNNNVQLLRSGPAPGFGSDFQGNYYAISAVGGAVFDAGNNPRIRTRLESQNVNVSFRDSSATHHRTTGDGL